MQIFELTSSKPNFGTGVGPGVKPQMTVTPTVNSAPAAATAEPPNFGTGVGPGVKPQMTATPTVNTAPAPAATGGTINRAAPANTNIAAQKPYVQGRAGQGKNPTKFAKYDPNTSGMANLGQGMRAMTAPMAQPEPNADPGMANLSQGMRAMTAPMAQPEPNADPGMANLSQGMRAMTTPRPEPETPAQAPGAYGQPTYNVPLTKVPTTNTMMPTNMSATGAPVAKAATAADPKTTDPTVAVTPATQEIEPDGHLAQFAKMLTRHNAEQAGVGYLINDHPTVTLDKEGKITVDGQPYNANNSKHVKAYQTFVANGGKNVASTPKKPGTPPATPPTNTTPGTPPATPPTTTTPGTPPATPPTNTTPGTPPESSGVELALKKLGYSPQGAAAMAAKVPPGMSEQDAIKLALSGKLRESLTWSRGFDPSRTLLKKIRQL